MVARRSHKPQEEVRFLSHATSPHGGRAGWFFVGVARLSARSPSELQGVRVLRGGLIGSPPKPIPDDVSPAPYNEPTCSEG